jgi:DNA invertase Pin-like site-specific DNA recombinase
MMSKRMRDGPKAKAAAGRKATGSYAYGFQPTRQGRERGAAPRSDEQDTVARIVELRRAGRSYREIAAALDAEGRGRAGPGAGHR